MCACRAAGPAPAARARRGARRAALLLFLTALPGCPPARDRIARENVESLQTNVNQIETILQSRQASVFEQIRELREDQSGLDRRIEENAREAKNVGQQVGRLRESSQESFEKLGRAQRESAQLAGEQIARVGGRLDTLQKDIQKGLQTVNDNLVALSAFEKSQEERIAKMQEQFQNQLKVVVEEVGQENQALTRAIGAVRADLEAARQETAAARQGLADLQGSVQQLAGQLAAAQAQLQEVVRRQSAQRAAAPASGGEHLVRAGETLTTIAIRYGVSVQAILEKNQLANADSINVGQKLVIPEP